ncbi:MAG: DnaJ domain-containing protein [Deltaproteobacteria bacterium]|jgi:curved DNA-binding protein CbpA|nr:DnaJ domain-containing protein [Deltaproteobacteria bacterium]
MKIHWQSDFYAALGLDQAADQETLRKAYLQLALQYHPDKNPGDRSSEEKFKLISQAYAVLRDPATRGRYDRMRRSKLGKAKAARAGTARKYKDWRHEPQPGYGGKAQAKPFPGAKPEGPEAARKGPGEGPPEPGPAFTAKPRGHDRTAAKARTRATNDDAEVMADLFKTKVGRESLDKVDEELKNAGLSQGLGRVMSQLRETFTGDQPGSVRSRAGNFLRSLKSKILANPLSTKETLNPEDIVFGLALTAEAAASGTTIDINYLRDNSPHHLSVKIPPGLTENTRLRLSGQGNLRPAGSRGDLLLDLNIQKP